jgi:nicotinamide-nucleotide amidase
VKLAVAESLTGGLVAAAITSVPGASDVFLGGVIAYTSSVKSTMLGVSARVLETCGPVNEDVAVAMAEGVRDAVGADASVAVTGVAGPAAHGGMPPGRVCIAVVGPSDRIAMTLDLPGNRDAVRAAAVEEALSALITIVERSRAGGTRVE